MRLEKLMEEEEAPFAHPVPSEKHCLVPNPLEYLHVISPYYSIGLCLKSTYQWKSDSNRKRKENEVINGVEIEGVFRDLKSRLRGTGFRQQEAKSSQTRRLAPGQTKACCGWFESRSEVEKVQPEQSWRSPGPGLTTLRLDIILVSPRQISIYVKPYLWS